MLIHLSDLHFGTEKTACIEAIQRFCLRHKPEVVVVSGDLTQRARFREFYACKQFLESLEVPYFVVPGNHDIPLYHLWKRVFRPFGYYQLFFGPLEHNFETAHFYFIGLNTIRPRFHTKGSISERQIEQVDQTLRQAPQNKLKIIVSHQPFYTERHDHHHIKDCPVLAETALQQWGRHQLFALLHGHLHIVAVYDLNQQYQLGLKHPVYEVHAGTATSHRHYKKTPNSFNVIDGNGNIQHYYFNAQTAEFEVKSDVDSFA
ncbi:3',5'-cyclic AMP phosphodiesterase CpdA [Acinetobacter calcoaceticus]|uniref:3',5'-cyclic AMP phosphodiesterase CpdA n=1 Tax=Acinetobacter calcoaceticus TaxID=471 RepID=A0A4R1Y4B5_ACICA|nr:3',5'-cyclic AMP phosphodiesterase CpdA [Acinetobacter calcoaceticus]